MSERVGLVHTTINAVEPMVDALRRYAPHLEALHFLDEGFVVSLRAGGGLTPALEESFAQFVARAVDTGVAGVLLSCSSFSPVVPHLDETMPVPVVSVDAAMLVQAVDRGPRIGVVATVSSALATATAALRRRAAEQGSSIEVAGELAPGAFDALKAGDGDRHDRAVLEAAQRLAPRVDVLVLAQISMSRAAPAVRGLNLPVLTSAETSVQALLERLKAGEEARDA